MVEVEISAERFAVPFRRYGNRFLSKAEFQRLWDESADGDFLFKMLQRLSSYHGYPIEKDGETWVPWVYVFHCRKERGWLPVATADQIRSLIHLKFT